MLGDVNTTVFRLNLCNCCKITTKMRVQVEFYSSIGTSLPTEHSESQNFEWKILLYIYTIEKLQYTIVLYCIIFAYFYIKKYV